MKATRNKRSRQVCRVFKVKIDKSKLSPKQAEQLKMMFVEGKWIKNSKLAWVKETGGSVFDLDSPHKHELVKVKDKNGDFVEHELKFIGSQMAQDVVAEMKSNLKTIIRLTKTKKQKHGELKFVSELRSLTLRQYGTTYSFKSHKKMKIQGVSGLVTISGAKQFLDDKTLELASAKLLNTPKGYYVAISTFCFKDDTKKQTKNGKTIGLDFGCQTSLTYSDGRKTTVQIEESERLKRLQRKITKQIKGSNNRYRTKKLIKIEYQKISNKKNDASNKIIAELKHYNNVVFQDEQLSNWKQNGHGKAVQHSFLGRIKAKLKLMDNAVILTKNIPTTKICMNCGKVHEMKLSTRIFQCECGISEDRDVHAAKNMVEVAKMLLDSDLSVPVGRREFKREEFLASFEKRFSKSYGTLIHEAVTL